ncbi:MAG: signal recognition particle-docking protein FtsY [Synechococcaceae cyanobacterium]
MVFDWFRRSSAPAEPEPPATAADDAGVEGATVAAPAEASDGDDGRTTGPATGPEAPTPATGAGTPASSAPAEPVEPTAAAGIDQDALAWAREAYARLKAQQEGSRGAEPPQAEPPQAEAVDRPAEGPAEAGSFLAGAIEPAPAPVSLTDSSAAAAAPEPAGEGPSGPLADLPPAPAAAPESSQAHAPEPPVTTLSPEPLPPPSSLPSAPTLAEAAPTLSLLEQAAAARQERLRQLTAPALEPPAVGAEPTAPAVELQELPGERKSGAEADSEPSLGAFDDAFTWSAEVLAAQGRRVEDVSIEEIDWLTRLRRGLEKTRRGFVTQLLETLGDDPLSPEVLDDLETTLLQADVGVQATDLVLDALRRRLNEEVVDPAEGLRFLTEQLRQLLDAPSQRDGRSLLAPSRERLNIWLLVGVNGVGKTTTLGKLANLAVRSGYSCLIAAADTFRAAAVEQVTVWGERSGVPVIANPSPHADPAAVVYDAIGAARSRGSELLLVDTAGRLQTKHNLMEELAKVRRIVDRLAPEAVVESLLVLDASQGQNGLRQAMAFAPAAGLTGVVLTKLDGSARGGVAIAVAHDAGLPIRFIGAGESVRDLRPFNSFEFVEALLSG